MVRLNVVLTHRFLVPKRKKQSETELLQQAVELANDKEYQKIRRQMYDWQERVLRFIQRKSCFDVHQPHAAAAALAAYAVRTVHSPRRHDTPSEEQVARW